MLEITLSRLRAFGIRDVIINVHHFADMIVEYLKANDNFGMRIEVSREEILLDTGGGLKKAAHFFLEDSSGLEEPFILHNVDVISTIDLGRMVQFHAENQALATLAVQDRETSRYLLFDEQLQLCGRRSGPIRRMNLFEPHSKCRRWLFPASTLFLPDFLRMMTEEGVFSIITSYLRLAAQGAKDLWLSGPMNIIGAIWAGRKMCCKPLRM